MPNKSNENKENQINENEQLEQPIDENAPAENLDEQPAVETEETSDEHREEIASFASNHADTPVSERGAAKVARKRKLKYGGMSALITVFFLAAVVMVNIIAGMVMERFNTTLDLSQNQLYTIEDRTRTFLQELDDKVKLTITSAEADFTNMSLYYSQMNEMAKVFQGENKDSISLQYVDLLKNPGFSANYDTELKAASIIVESEKTGRYKILVPQDYISVKYYTQDGQTVSEQDASYMQMLGMQVYQSVGASTEQAILSALMSVTNADPVRVAFTTGYGEGIIEGSTEMAYAGLEKLLTDNAFITETIDMNLAESIDAAIDYLVLFAPTADYSTNALTLIDQWLDNQAQYGKNLIYVSGLSSTQTPNIDAFLAEWGLSVGSGFIYQADTQYAGSNSFEQYLQPTEEYGGNTLNKRFISSYVRPVNTTFEAYSNITTKPLLTSYDGAVIVPFDADDSFNPQNEPKGVYNVITESNKVRYDGTTPFNSRVIAVGSPYFFDSYFLQAEQVGHSEYTIQMLNTISGKEQSVSIAPKSFSMPQFAISAQQANGLALVFCIVLPVAVFVIGLVVWVRRRYL